MQYHSKQEETRREGEAMERAQQQSSDSILATLSVDLLIQILDRVADPRDRKSWRQVCRGFLLAEALRRRSLRVLRREALQGLLRRYAACLERLDLSACPALDDHALAAALAAGAGLWRLRSVNLSRASGVGWRGLAALAKACPHLEAVDLSHCVGVGDREAAALAAAAGLRELWLDKCLGLTDVGLAKVAVGCPALEMLGIKWCLEISDIGIELLAKKCQNLRVLDISYLKITNRSLQFVSSLGKLEDLSMVGCSHIDDAGLQFLNNGSNSLQSVDVSRCENVTSSGLISVIEGHKYLQNLNIGDCFPELAPLFLSKLNDLRDSLTVLKLDGFQVFAPSLKIIGLNCRNLVEIGLSKSMKYLSRCSELKVLKLGLCDKISDEGLVHIASNGKKLRVLDLYRCFEVTDDGLAAIATGCKRIKNLNLCYCTRITDLGLKHLSCLEDLLDLELRGVHYITSLGITAIANGCQHLTELDLKHCHLVDDAGLFALGQYTKNLRQANLSYCQVSSMGLCNLLSSLKCLQDVKLVHLTRVPVEGFESALRASGGRLKKLKLLTGLRHLLSPGLIQMLQAWGCRIRWVDKPLNLVP
ncbi:F-box LRR-repeat protein 3 [Musa troglodytarum]|uniref:F-box LRR-repeat protein 3 n=1 Tax=Musa troglodytarum TaxID=320322 RepID=A0A9E7JFY3_9LILI|nr:F-box LRR-repeat protein 3 [Musa troglodytarum]